MFAIRKRMVLDVRFSYTAPREFQNLLGTILPPRKVSERTFPRV